MAILMPIPEPTDTEYNALEHILVGNEPVAPLAARFRALFTLRAIGTHRAIDIIGEAFDDSSALLGHELAYCLGQIADEHALPLLEAVLKNKKQHPMVRHEAAEAMGAISSLRSLPVLRTYLADPKENVSVRETCEIAIAKIEYDHGLGQNEKGSRSVYDSIDPAPPASMHATSSSASTLELRHTLLDSSQSLFARYRAMFGLRNMASSHPEDQEPVDALADGFSDQSALFRHEIAYIFGQLCSPLSVPALLRVLKDDGEDEMVRHEAAEALGGIASNDQASLEVLRQYAQKPGVPRVVRESCEVALDMWEREQAGTFESLEDSIKNASHAVSMAA